MTDQAEFTVVESDDGRISLWPTARELPWGWRHTGFSGTREQCLDRIEADYAELAPVGGSA